MSYYPLPFKAYLIHSIILLFMLLLGACAGSRSAPQEMVHERNAVYQGTYKAYIEAEKKYINLLFNIERMPEEEELWIMKRDQMKELIYLRDLMLVARGELDAAIQDWERYIQNIEDEAKKPGYRSPNLRGHDANRSSPGELLPFEAVTGKKKK